MPAATISVIFGMRVNFGFAATATTSRLSGGSLRWYGNIHQSGGVSAKDYWPPLFLCTFPNLGL
jgi:hypothetical protein